MARYSGSERPACRMNHTGVRSTGSRRAARTSSGSIEALGYPAVSSGPYAVRFGAFPALPPHAGTVEQVQLEVENVGSLAWRHDLFVSYHWLDTRDNPIHWDGLRAPAPPLAPGERASVE